MTGKARILFVDDEKRVLNAMRGLFRRDYELFLASSGADAVDIAASNDIDVIVADQRMPGMTGIEVLAKVKEQSPRTVRILLTGYADPGAIEGSINIGEVFRFLSKPCPPNVLRETLRLAIEASRTAPAAPPTGEKPAAARPPAAETGTEAHPAPEPTPTPGTDPEDTQPSLTTLSEDQAPPHAPSPDWGTATNVVMSGDTVEEDPEPADPAAAPGPRDIGVVVFTVDSEFAATAIRAVSSERATIVATTLVKVAKAIQDEKAGVLVTDFASNKSVLQNIIAALKQKMPELVTITVSDGRDSDDMIRLINYGQVFRYLVKPVEEYQLRADINAAVVRHLYLLDNPDAAKRHQVVEEPKSSKTLSRFFGGGDPLQRRRPAS